MSEKRDRSFAGGCLGTFTGAILGGIVGAITAHALGFRTTGSAFFLALDVIVYFCVGGGALVGAIVGREIFCALAGVSRRGSPRRGPEFIPGGAAEIASRAGGRDLMPEDKPASDAAPGEGQEPPPHRHE